MPFLPPNQQHQSTVLLYNYNIWSSVFSHVVHLDTYIPEDFDVIRLFYWLIRMSLPLFRTWQAMLFTGSNGQFQQLCHVSSCTLVVCDGLFPVVAHSASHIIFLFVYFHFDGVRS